MNFKLEELTKENEAQYLEQVANLEQVVMANMEARGQSGQLFPTGREDISAYAHSKENTVLVAVDENGKVIAATYITQGQQPFTYNDITKYFKYGDDYKQYVKTKYKTLQDYRADMLNIYNLKIQAFKYAKQKVLEQFPQYGENITAFLQHEIDEENNHFHEKSVLREMLNRYMSEYMQNQDKTHPGVTQRYEMFYWTTADDIAKEFGKTKVEPKAEDAKALETFISGEKEELEYQKILHKGPLVIHEKPNFDVSKYYTAKTSNAIELDTYITDPQDRRSGLARILLLEGITKHMEEFFADEKQQEIFLCSTLHRNNLSSKYVSEFFGLTDSLYVKRRDGRDREVHICRVGRSEYKHYLDHIKKKVAVLYGYNPEKKAISNKEKIEVLKEQLKYEQHEISRLKGARTAQTHNGKIDFKQRKIEKIIALNEKIKELQEKEEQVAK